MNKKRIGVRIDKLTNSIQNALNGEILETDIFRLYPTDADSLRGSTWQFDWTLELRNASREVYKLITVENPTIVQGLISMENFDDHIFVHLIENAQFNKGRQKLYVGVPANLFAFACKKAFEQGHEGAVVFESKTTLIYHYEQTIGAQLLWGIRMLIDTPEADKLVRRYFKDSNHGTQQNA